MPTQQQLGQIAALLQGEIKKSLSVPRQSRGYYGNLKSGFSAPIASGSLLESVEVQWEGSIDNGDLELVVRMDDYWYFVENGRKPGRMPPIAPIDKWVVQKAGLSNVVRDQSGRFIKRKSLVYLIRRSIGRYGYAGTHFLDRAIYNSIDTISERMGEVMAEWFFDRLNGIQDN